MNKPKEFRKTIINEALDLIAPINPTEARLEAERIEKAEAENKKEQSNYKFNNQL